LFGAAVAVGSSVAAPIVSAGQVHLPWALCMVLGATVPIAILELILSISFTDPAGLRMVVVVVVFSTGLNLVLSVVLAAPWGAVGPAFASMVALTLQTLVLAVLARKRLHSAAGASCF
jgi:peptidoglycan biosynthesis protein MviN/MurJ (putative lipid II flippase)